MQQLKAGRKLMLLTDISKFRNHRVPARFPLMSVRAGSSSLEAALSLCWEDPCISPMKLSKCYMNILMGAHLNYPCERHDSPHHEYHVPGHAGSQGPPVDQALRPAAAERRRRHHAHRNQGQPEERTLDVPARIPMFMRSNSDDDACALYTTAEISQQ